MASLFDTQINRIKEEIKAFLKQLEKRRDTVDTSRVCSSPNVCLSAVADSRRIIS
jgi:hypothetical protein